MCFLLFRKGIVGYPSTTDVDQRNLVAIVPTRVDNPNMRSRPHNTSHTRTGINTRNVLFVHFLPDFCFPAARANISRLNLALRLKNALSKNKSEQSNQMSFEYSGGKGQYSVESVPTTYSSFSNCQYPRGNQHINPRMG